MNNKTPLALASAALLTLALGGCASTGMDAGVDSPDAAADTSVSGSAGSTMSAGTTGTAGTMGTAGATGTTGAMSGTTAGSTIGAATSTGTTAGATAGDSGMAGTAGSATSGATAGNSAMSGSTAGTTAAGTATTGSVASGGSTSGDVKAGAAASGSMKAGAVPKASSPAEALTLVALVDQHELKLAQLTQSKQVSEPVMEYAKMMVNDHTPHLAKTRSMLDGAGGMQQDSAGARELMQLDQQTMARLNGLQGDAYARAYMDHMVESHQMGIAMVAASMSVAKDESQREFLKTTKETMQKHLQHAQKVKGQLKG
jgi:putative membrane protein